MPFPKPSNDGTFQIDTDNLFSTYPQFYAAGDAISDAAKNLNTTLSQSISAFDGDTQKKLQSLGNDCVTNLKGLSDALNEIATRLQQSANTTQTVEGNNTHMF